MERKPKHQREACDDSLKKDFPLVHDVLTTCRFEGKDIEPFSLGLSCFDGRFQVRLVDRHNRRVAYQAIKSPTSFLEAAEAALRAFDELDWRPFKKDSTK
jgi:hypothetical protein